MSGWLTNPLHIPIFGLYSVYMSKQGTLRELPVERVRITEKLVKEEASAHRLKFIRDDQLTNGLMGYWIKGASDQSHRLVTSFGEKVVVDFEGFARIFESQLGEAHR